MISTAGAIRGLLAGLGRRAGLVLALGICIGFAVPPLASAFAPLLSTAVVGMLTFSILRVDLGLLRRALTRPLRLSLVLLWLLVAMPVLVHAALAPMPIAPWLRDHLVLTAACAPILSSAGIAALFRLDGALALAASVIGSALLPLSLPIMANVLSVDDLPVSPAGLAWRLGLLVFIGFALAVVLRRWIGIAALVREAPAIDGAMVINLVVFGIAVMDGVQALVVAQPSQAWTLLVAIFGLALGMQVLGTLLFRPFGAEFAATVGLLSAFGNFGLVVASLGTAVATSTLLFLGLNQFPIYLLPGAQRRYWLRRAAITNAEAKDAG